MATDVSGVSSGNQSNSEMLVESFKQTQAYRVDSLTEKKSELQSRQNFYNGLNTKLNTLISSLDAFGSYKDLEGSKKFVKDDGIDAKFQTRSAVLTDKDYFTVTAKGNAIVGNNTVKSQRLATNDVLVSKRLNLADSFTETAGEKTFNITVNGKEHNVKVNFLGTESNEEAMTKIVNAINGITDVNVSASLVKDTETTGRISLVSKETGTNNQITFSENSTTKLLGWDENLFKHSDKRTVMQGVSAGFKKADAAELTAKFEVNGIEISRNKNEVDDVLPGLTIKLLKVQDADAEPVNVTTDIDPSGVEKLVDTMVKDFNGLLYYLNSNIAVKKVDPGMGTLQSKLRSIVSARMSDSTEDGAPHYITDIGFKIGSDGTITLNDKEKLKEYLAKENGAQKVADLFTSETGFAAKVNEAIVNLKPQGGGEIGLIKSRNQSITTQIVNLDKRIATVESSIEQQADTMRKEYESYLKVYLEAQGQYSLLSTMGTTSSDAYSSLLASQYSS